VATVLLVVLSVLTFSTAAFAQFTPPPGVTVTPGGENCNGIVPTPGSENTVKTLTGLTVDAAGTHAQYTIAYPVDPAHVGDTFQIVDCVLSGTGADLSKYDVVDEATFDGVVNSTSFNLTFKVTIPASTPVGTRICNVAKTTEGPSAPSASNRKAGPACFLVGGDVRVLKLSTTAPNDTANPIGGATFTVWACVNTAGNNSVLQPIIVLPTPSSGDIYSATLAGGGVVHATAGVVSFAGPSGSTCKITETSPPSGYELPPTVTQTVTIPVGTGGATVYKFLDPPSPGSIEIDKTAPAAEQSTVFHFTITCTGPSNTYHVQVTGTNNVTQSGVPAGSSCTVTEDDPGSTFNPPVISPADAFTVASGQTVTVTVTNSLKPGSIEIDKTAPAAEQSTVFHFTITCTGPSNTYHVQVTGTNSVTQGNIPAGSSCTVTEDDPGSTFNAPVIDPSGAFPVGANQTVTVTVTNSLKDGSVTINKTAPESESATVFHFTITCTNPSNTYNVQVTGSGSVSQTGIPAGSSCQVTETGLATKFNTPTIDPSGTFIVDANAGVTVNVTNTLKPGSVTIEKTAPASESETVFNFTITCTNPSNTYHVSVTGTGSVSQSGIPAGSSCTVTEDDPGSTFNTPVVDPSGAFTVDANTGVTVTVTNTLKDGSLKITKVAPAGATDTYTFNINCGGENTYQLQITGSGSATQGNIPAGSVCTIVEVLPAGYAQPVYVPSNQVTVGANQTVEVSVTNTLLPLGISIVKTANPTSGAPGDPVTYTYVVKNTGKVDLINVSVDDDKLGHVGTIASLIVGESKTLTFNTHLPNNAGLLTNVGTAVGHDRFGRTTKASDNATVIVVLPIFLPRTGSDSRFPAAAGFAFLGIGIAILKITRKRQDAIAEEIDGNQM